MSNRRVLDAVGRVIRAGDRTPSPPDFLLDAEEFLASGAIMASRGGIEAAARIVSPDDFYLVSYRQIWGAAVAVVRGGHCCTPATIGYELTRRGQIEDYGIDERKLVDLAYSAWQMSYNSEIVLTSHASIVHEYGERRRALGRLSEEATRIVRGQSTRPGGGVAI